MAIAYVTVCDCKKIRVLNGLPDVPYPICAILTADTHRVKVIYDNPTMPAIIDAKDAARQCGCDQSDLAIIDYDTELEIAYEGAPWCKDLFVGETVRCITSMNDEEIRIVDDFSDLY